MLQLTQEIKLTNDKLEREKTEFRSMHSMHTHGENSVMSNSKGWLEFGAYITKLVGEREEK